MAKGGGWLVVEERKERRDSPDTLTDSDVAELIEQLDKTPAWTKEDETTDRLIRTRDKALIALSWIFFKRGGENLGLKLSDAFVGAKQFSITYKVEKKVHKRKICPKCRQRNSSGAHFCKRCGTAIKDTPVHFDRNERTFTKHKTLESPFAKHLLAWLDALKGLGAGKDSWLFPRYNWLLKRWDFTEGYQERDKEGNPIGTPLSFSIQWFDQGILQRLDPTLTSSFFRYGHTEKLQRAGKSTRYLRQAGDWDSDKMPEIYAHRKGLTEADIDFAGNPDL